ncbi:MAG: oligosaccharide flippase family protein [Jannaschia sp.]
MLRSVSILLFGNASVSLLTLVRNLVIARLITVEDYGIAATFAIAMAVVEMMSAIGLEQQIVQSRKGDDPDFQAALQGFTVMRGLASCLLLVLTAGLLADFLGVPDLAWAYQVMALVPLIRAFSHFDNHRYKRNMRFSPMLWTQGGGAVAAVLVVWPAWAIWPDFRVMMISLLVQVAVVAAMSHILAERAYRLRIDTGVWRGSLDFGWPLLINNFLLFAVMHGEKLVAGRELGLEALGILAMGLTLTMTPTLILARSIQDFFLPQLSAAQDDDAAFQALSEVTIQAMLAMTLLYLLGMVLVAGPVVMLLLGEKYAVLVPLMIWLAIQQGIRVFRSAADMIALGRGQTSNPMIANSVRVASLPVAWWVAASGGGLEGVIAVAIVGETIGTLTSLAMIRIRLGIVLRTLALPLLASGVVLVLMAGLAWRATADIAGTFAPLAHPVETALVVAAILLALVVQRQLWRYVARRKVTIRP